MSSFIKYVSALTWGLILSVFPLIADDSFHRRDFEIVESFLTSKRTMEYYEKKDVLKISGDIRAEWIHRNETENHERLRGDGAVDRNGVPIPCDTYEAVMNLRFDYNCGGTWAAGYFQFDDDMGTFIQDVTCREDNQACFGSGTCDDICIKRGYWGLNVFDNKCIVFDIEIGRRPMYTIFDSRIEFQARFDGILFKLNDKVKGNGDFYVNGGPFIVDYAKNHYAFVIEVGALDIMDQGLDAKFSYIDWRHRGRNRCGIADPGGWRFENYQWSLAYNFPEKVVPKKLRFYGAILWNAAARRLELTHGKLANIGWYVGFITGEVKKKYDWSLDVNYQVVQAQSVSDCDMHGIGRGNIKKNSFPDSARGKANFRGWHFELLYAITNKLSFDGLVEFTHAADPSIGGEHGYCRYEIDFIHAF